MSGFGQNPPGTSAFTFPSLNQPGTTAAATGFTFGTPKSTAPGVSSAFGSTPSFGLTGAAASAPLPQSTTPGTLFGTTFGSFSPGSNVAATSTTSAAPTLAPAAGALAKSSPFTFGTPASTAATQLPTSSVVGMAAAPTLGATSTFGATSTLGTTTLGATPTLGATSSTLGAASMLGSSSTLGATSMLGATPTLGTSATLGATPTLATTSNLGTTATPTLGASSTLCSSVPTGPAPAFNFAFGMQTATTTSAAPTSSASLSIPTIGVTSTPKPQTTMPATVAMSVPASSISTVSSSVKFPTTSTTPQSVAAKTATFAAGMTMFSTSSTSATTTTSTSAITTSAPATSSAVTTSTVSGSTSEEDVMTYSKLQENINKWALELEKQEKLFLHQATEMNGWDRVIVENSEKLHNLNGKIEKVRREQRHLDLELDFVLSQQNELDYMLKGLEKEWGSVPPLDPERQHTYKIAESLDYKLKVMSEDLKEVVDHMNAMNYPPNDEFNPVMQIVRILNAHMNVLLMVERKTNLAETKVKEVGKLLELCKRDCDRACHLYFD